MIGSVPNAASLDFQLFRDAWYALQVPTHLYHFTPRTLTQLLIAAGFCDVKIQHQRILANYPPSLAYRLEDLWGPTRLVWLRRSLKEYVRAPQWVAMAAYPLAYAAAALGQTGRMTVWARAP